MVHINNHPCEEGEKKHVLFLCLVFENLCQICEGRFIQPPGVERYYHSHTKKDSY